MKDFMLIFKGTNYADMGFSPEELQQRLGKWWAWSEKMKEAGVLKEGNALQAGVRKIKGSDRVVTDLTSAELKEVIGGYYVVTVRDIDHATEVAQGYPDYDLDGEVEVRAVMVYEH